LIRAPECLKIREQVAKQADSLFQSAIFDKGDELVQKAGPFPADLEAQNLLFTGVEVIEALGANCPQVLKPGSTVIRKLLDLWTSPVFSMRLDNATAASGRGIPLRRVNEPKVLARALLLYAKANKDDIRVLFQMLSFLTRRSLVDSCFLKDFL
jgi:hypothetical protein